MARAYWIPRSHHVSALELWRAGRDLQEDSVMNNKCATATWSARQMLRSLPVVERLTHLGRVFRRVKQTDKTEPPPTLLLTHSVLAAVPPAHSPSPAEILEGSIWEWIHVWHSHTGGKGLCLLRLHTAFQLLTEQKLKRRALPQACHKWYHPFRIYGVI